MSTTNSEELEAGREIDALVAERVFGRTARVYTDALGESLYLVDESASRTGPHSSSANLIGGGWQRGVNESGESVEFYGRPCPPYSTDIRAAWEVIEALHEKGFITELCIHRGHLGDAYAVSMSVATAHGHAYGGQGQSAPLAICRAALGAVDKASPASEGTGKTDAEDVKI